MADAPPPTTPPGATAAVIRDDFPPWNFPTVFADGVSSISQSSGNVKFYLARIEPNLHGTGTSQVTPFAQVVMSATSFAHTVVFFEQQLKIMIEQRVISEEFMTKLRAGAGENAG
jgi:hypothetical protein